jgi:peroxiredoxin Q/BCP
MIKIGEKLEELTFIFDDNKNVSSQKFIGKKTIIYFYPKDDTPGCTKEAIEFSQLAEKFNKINVEIIGVSKDSIEKHQKFRSKHNIKIRLASDENINICKKFDVWSEKSMYGKKFMGIERSTFVFDEDLILKKIWRKVKVNGHAKEVYDFLSSLT